MIPPIEVHLLCITHGMWGNPVHVAQVAQAIEERAQRDDDHTELEVLVSESNREASTYDGIDWGGERVADEIREKVKNLEADHTRKVVKFSIVGYSFGGLVARYAIGVLQASSFFESIKPINFTTIATPHIGLPKYPTFISSMARLITPRLMSRTGEQFYSVDNWNNTGKPLLAVMADPQQIFVKVLQRFENITIYANAINDTTVPYVTAAIEAHDPYMDFKKSGVQVHFEENYKPLISSYHVPDVPPAPAPRPPLLTKAWLKSFKIGKPPVPPFLVKKFPLNILIYLSLPIIYPTLLCLVLTRFSLDSKASKARISQLEKDASKLETRLINILRKLEQEVDEAVSTLLEEPASKSLAVKEDKHATLSPTQLKMIANLNQALPHMKKRTVFIEQFFSHAMIVNREIERFDPKFGEGVLRHVADGFVF